MDNKTKEKLRDHNRFHRVNTDTLVSIDEYAEWLESLFHNGCYIWEDANGEKKLIETRKAITRLKGLKIEIYSNEHPPPHFHVKSPNVNAIFDIENCKKLKGTIDSKDYKLIKYWHKKSKDILIKAWNERRPTECTVGNYEEKHDNMPYFKQN